MSNKFLSKMLYALTSAYSRKDYDNVQLGLPLETNIGKLFSILAWGLETIEEQAELVRLWDDLDYASGSVLDRYGANFGVKRVSADDRFYRLAIKVKIYRTYRYDLTLLHCAFVDTDVSAVPVSQDRESTEVLGVNFGGYLGAKFAPPPFSADRTAQMPVQLSRGAVQTPTLTSTPPDVKRAHRGRQDGAGGVVYHTHIKSKRID